MNPAQATRLEKEKHPERFCSHKSCLWRTLRFDGRYVVGGTVYDIPVLNPCRKHSKAEAASPIVRGSKVRRIDEPYVVLHVREVDSEGTLFAGTPKALCFNSFGHGKWMRIDELEVVT